MNNSDVFRFRTMNARRLFVMLVVLLWFGAATQIQWAVYAASAGDTVSVSNVTYNLPDRGLLAHRGAMYTHPENTLAALREAIRLGVQAIEFDVRFTRDKKIILMHDPTVDRTTDGRGKVSDLTLAQIKQLDAGSWKSPQFKGERVPTLTEAMAIMPYNAWIFVDANTGGGGAELGRQITQFLIKHDRAHQVIMLGRPPTIRAAKKICPEILINNLFRQDNGWKYVDSTIAMKADFLHFLGPIVPEFHAYTQKLKNNGVRYNYTGAGFQGVESAEELRALFSMGFSFILVDEIVPMREAARELGIQPVKPVFSKLKE